MPVHLAFTAGGTALLAVSSEFGRATSEVPISILGATGWAAGVAVFAGTISWTIRDNLTGRETGTGDVNAARERVDRLANAAAPVALAYLVVGSYGLLAHYAALPGSFGYFPVVSHLLAAGTAALLVFGVGFRLLPRFLAVDVHYGSAALVVTSGVVAPLLLAFGLVGDQRLFRAGAVLQGVAVLGFVAAYGSMFLRSDRRRVGLYGVLIGGVAGAFGVLLGLDMALRGVGGGLAPIHFRLNVIGFLGLTIVGVAYQFYPPTAGTFRFATNRTAFVAMICLGGGLLLQAVGAVATGDTGGTTVSVDALVAAGKLAVLLGAIVHAGLLAGLFRERYGPGL